MLWEALHALRSDSLSLRAARCHKGCARMIYFSTSKLSLAPAGLFFRDDRFADGSRPSANNSHWRATFSMACRISSDSSFTAFLAHAFGLLPIELRSRRIRHAPIPL
jgi:hypothetical protein